VFPLERWVTFKLRNSGRSGVPHINELAAVSATKEARSICFC